jgi:hypothetical protein
MNWAGDGDKNGSLSVKMGNDGDGEDVWYPRQGKTA